MGLVLMRIRVKFTNGYWKRFTASIRHRSNPGVGGIFFLTLAPFLLHFFRYKSLSLSP